MIAKKGTLTKTTKPKTKAKPKAKVAEEREVEAIDESEGDEIEGDEIEGDEIEAIESDETDEADEMVEKAVKKPAKKSTAPKLPGASLRHLRGLGHDLAPVVMVGKEGITPSLVRATNAALLTHELIKVKVQSEAPIDRRDAAASLAEESDAVLAQVLGRTFLLYKRSPKKPKIKLPRA